MRIMGVEVKRRMIAQTAAITVVVIVMGLGYEPVRMSMRPWLSGAIFSAIIFAAVGCIVLRVALSRALPRIRIHWDGSDTPSATLYYTDADGKKKSEQYVDSTALGQRLTVLSDLSMLTPAQVAELRPEVEDYARKWRQNWLIQRLRGRMSRTHRHRRIRPSY